MTNGGASEIYNEDGTLRFDNPETVAAYDFYNDCTSSPRPTPPTGRGARPRPASPTRPARMVLQFTVITTYDTQAEGDAADLGVAPIPHADASDESNTIAYSNAVMLLSEDEAKRDGGARSSSRFLLEPENYGRFLNMEPGLFLPVTEDGAKAESFWYDPMVGEVQVADRDDDRQRPERQALRLHRRQRLPGIAAISAQNLLAETLQKIVIDGEPPAERRRPPARSGWKRRRSKSARPPGDECGMEPDRDDVSWHLAAERAPAPYILVAPVLLWLGATLVYPLASAIGLSVRDVGSSAREGPSSASPTTPRLLDDTTFLARSAGSVIWVVGNAVRPDAPGPRSRRWSSHQKFPGVKVARTWIILTWIVPTIVVVIIWRWLLLDLGRHDQPAPRPAAASLDRPVGFFASSTSAMATLVLINSWRWFPFVAVMLLAGLQRIPEDLYEAARDRRRVAVAALPLRSPGRCSSRRSSSSAWSARSCPSTSST